MILVICGPTASGKSSLAIEVAKSFNGEIINGDAFQVYKELNIGTAKPTLEERAIVPHHLFDFVSPSVNYSVMEYQKAAREEISSLLDDNKLVVIVGGTGLYQKATLYDYEFKATEAEPDLSDLDNLNNIQLYDYLDKLDHEAAVKTHPNNRKRVLRAIAIIRMTGEKKSEIENEQKHELIYDDVHFIGLESKRETLYVKINNRVDEMFDEGLEQEVKALFSKYNKENNAFKGIGYKEFIPYFEGQITLEDLKDLIKKNTRNYAKRQFTFFRHQLPVQWYENKEDAYAAIKKVVENHE